MGEMDDVLEAPPGWLTLPEVEERLGWLRELVIDAIEAGRLEAIRERSGRSWRYLITRESFEELLQLIGAALFAMADFVGMRAELEAWLARKRLERQRVDA